MGGHTPRERLYEVFTDPELDTDERIRRGLEVGRTHLGLPIGLVTRIEEDRQIVEYAVGDHDGLQPGETRSIDEAYCCQTLEFDGPLAVHDDAVSPVDRPGVDTCGLSAYIGAKVLVDDRLYGTVCFADRDSREAAFAESEELFLELLASLVGSTLQRRAYERDLKERADGLRREKQHFEAMAENSSDIIFRIGTDGSFTYVSSAAERMLAYSPEELTGEPFSEFVTEDALEEAVAAYARVLDGEAVENLELEFLDRHGDPVVIEVNATPIREDGSVTGVQGVGRDVTSREERIHELRIKNQAMDEAEVGISIADPGRPDSPLVYINDGFERLTGYEGDDAVGRNCRFLQGDETDPEAVGRIREGLEARESVAVELVNYRRDGTPFWNHLRLNPVFDDRGELSYYIGFQSDVTERKRTERVNQLLNRVFRHNLRNDVNALQGWGRELRRGADPTAVGARIENITRRLVEVSDHARELERHARRERRPQRLVPEPLVADARDACLEQFPDASIDVTVRTSQHVCAGAEFREALEELVENAVKHNHREEPRVSVTVEEEGQWVELVVSDDGPGIDPMEANVISAGKETPLVHGSGLGVWLVNWVVTRYGGSFQIAPEQASRGTTATVRLPALAPGEPVEAAERGPTVLSF